jgi:hypothetical protein
VGENNTMASSIDGKNWMPNKNTTGLDKTINGLDFASMSTESYWLAVGLSKDNKHLAFSSFVNVGTDSIDRQTSIKWKTYNLPLFNGAEPKAVRKWSKYIVIVGSGSNPIIIFNMDSVKSEPDSSIKLTKFSTLFNKVIGTLFEIGYGVAHDEEAKYNWVAVGRGNKTTKKPSIVYSKDGTNWSPVNNSEQLMLQGNAVVCNKNMVVAVGEDSNTNNTIMYSTNNGTTWTAVQGSNTIFDKGTSIIYNGLPEGLYYSYYSKFLTEGYYIATGIKNNKGVIAFSPDGIIWSSFIKENFESINSIACSFIVDRQKSTNKYCVVAGKGNQNIMYSDTSK